MHPAENVEDWLQKLHIDIKSSRYSKSTTFIARRQQEELRKELWENYRQEEELRAQAQENYRQQEDLRKDIWENYRQEEGFQKKQRENYVLKQPWKQQQEIARSLAELAGVFWTQEQENYRRLKELQKQQQENHRRIEELQKQQREISHRRTELVELFKKRQREDNPQEEFQKQQQEDTWTAITEFSHTRGLTDLDDGVPGHRSRHPIRGQKSSFQSAISTTTPSPSDGYADTNFTQGSQHSLENQLKDAPCSQSIKLESCNYFDSMPSFSYDHTSPRLDSQQIPQGAPPREIYCDDRALWNAVFCCSRVQYESFGESGTSGSSSTCSTSSSEETDWNNDFEAGSEADLGGGQDPYQTELPLQQARTELADRIMKEFWVLFNEEWCVRSRQKGESSSKTSSSTSATHPNSLKSLPGFLGSKRIRRNDEDDDLDESDRKKPKRFQGGAMSPAGSEDSFKYACPFRKHNARKYCVKDWRSCALTAHLTVGRVKAHLYRYHLIHQCQRCKVLFESDLLLDTHIEAVEGCDLNVAEPIDGVTRRMKERLQSRKKAFRGQTEAQRWEEIYDILFPDATGPKPSPFFEPVRDGDDDDLTQTPDSGNISNFEHYLRRETPRLFRIALEREINAGILPIEERLRGQIITLMRQAQDQAFESYRAILSSIPSSDHVLATSFAQENLLISSFASSQSALEIIQGSSIFQAASNHATPDHYMQTSTLMKKTPSQSSLSSQATTLSPAEDSMNFEKATNAVPTTTQVINNPESEMDNEAEEQIALVKSELQDDFSEIEPDLFDLDFFGFDMASNAEGEMDAISALN